MGTTPTRGLPHPEQTDKVMDGWANIRDLALAVEAELDEDKAAASAAFVSKAGGSEIVNTDPAKLGLGINAATGQAGSLLRIRNAAGAALAQVNPNGGIYTPYDPPSGTDSPATYPLGMTVGAVVAGSWPATGLLITHKRSDSRVAQFVLSIAAAGPIFTRQTDVNAAWQAWRQIGDRYYSQSIDLPSIAANSTVNIDIATSAGAVGAGERVIYLFGLTSHGLVMQGVTADVADTIRLRVSNLTGAAIDQAAVTFRFLIAGAA
jgi:hypothetical protein